MTDTAHDASYPAVFPYESEGETVYRGRVRTSGTAPIDRPLHRGERCAVVIIGEVDSWGVGVYEKLPARLHALSSEETYVVPEDAARALIRESAVKVKELEDKIAGVIQLPLDGDDGESEEE
jgi:hypothetical protein